MSIKSEPMEFLFGELEHSTAIPLHLVPNSTVTDDRAAMQTSRDSLFSSQAFTGMNQNLQTTDDILQTDRLVSERVVSASKQNDFNNSHNVKIHTSSKTHSPHFTIARGEIELNSKFLPKKYRCGFCVYKTSYKSDLNRHLRRHTQDANFHCEECNMPFKTEGLVYHHKRTAHGERSSSVQINYQCHMCPYGTTFEARYSRHMQLHSTGRFVCDVCNKPFSLEAMLKQHQENVHGMVNPFGRFESHSVEIGNIQNAKCFQVSPVSSPNSFPPLSFKTNMDNLSSGSSNYSSGPNLNNDKASVGYEVSENSIQQMVSVSHTIPNAGGSLSVGNNSFDVSNTNELNGVQNVTASPKPAFLNSSRVDMSLRQGDTRNQLSKQRLAQYHSISPTVYSKKSESPDLLGLSDSLNTSVKPVTNNDNKSVSITSSSGIKRYCCEQCGLAFTTLDGILNHKSSCMAVNVNRVKACTLCPFQTINQHVFERHFQKHSLAPYCCEMCNRPFIAVANLIKHKRELHRNTSKRNTALSRSLKNNIPLPCTRSNAQSSRDTCSSVSKQKTKNFELQSQGIYSFNRPYIIRKTADVLEYDDGVSNLPSKPVNKMGKKTEILVSSEPPEFGRFAKLVSDFDEFASRPYACALCFFRTNNTAELTVHVENHLTGCNLTPIPETARFIQRYNPRIESHYRGPKTSRSTSRQFQREHICIDNQSQGHCITELPGSCDGILNNTINNHKTQNELEKNRKSNNENNCGKELKPRIKLVRRQHRKSAMVFVKRRKLSNCRAFVCKSSLPGRTSFRCRSCEKSFSMRAILVRHENKIHGCCATVGHIK